MATSTSVNVFEKYMGKLTSYHYYMFITASIPKCMAFWHMINFMYLTPSMQPNCTCPCPEPNWDTSVFTKIIQMKYNVICEEVYLVQLSQSGLYFGTLIGAFCFGFYSDRYGRLIAFTLSLQVIAFAGCLTVIMPDMYTWIAMRIVEGIGVGGSVVTGYVLVVEFFGIKYRDAASSLYHIGVNFGVITMAGISYLLRDCDAFQLALSIPVFGTVVIICLLQESPKWLVNKRKFDRTEKTFKKVMQWNKVPTDTIHQELEALFAEETASDHMEKVSFWKVFTYKRLTINFFCMAFMFFTCGMGYYGVTQYIGKMSGDPHLNLILSGCMLVVATLVCTAIIGNIGRKKLLMGTNFLSGVLMLAVIILPSDMTWLRVFLACLGCCMFFMAFIVVFLYGVELFPTCIRNSVLGALSLLSRLGQIIAPLINVLPELISGGIFGVCALIAAALVLPLPETRGVELPSTLEEAHFKPVSKK